MFRHPTQPATNEIDWRPCSRLRSFVPMLNLFAAFDVPEAQHWATWEVYNMIIKDREFTTVSCLVSVKQRVFLTSIFAVAGSHSVFEAIRSEIGPQIFRDPPPPRW